MSRTAPISANFTWDADLGDLQERLNTVAEGLQDTTRLMAAIGAAIEGNVKVRFQTKVDPNGEPWAQLADSTLARYAAEDEGGPRRGTLLQRGVAPVINGKPQSGYVSMSTSLSVNATAEFAEIGFNSLVDGGEYQKSVLHEFGTERMPRRGILLGDPEAGTLGATDLAEVQATVDDFLADLLAGP